MLLDEPTTGVDPAARRKMWETINAIRRSIGFGKIQIQQKYKDKDNDKEEDVGNHQRKIFFVQIKMFLFILKTVEHLDIFFF